MTFYLIILYYLRLSFSIGLTFVLIFSEAAYSTERKRPSSPSEDEKSTEKRQKIECPFHASDTLQKIEVDRIVKEISENRQKDVIRQICTDRGFQDEFSKIESFKQLVHFSFQDPEKNSLNAAGTCLEKISNLWSSPNELKNLLKKDPVIQTFLMQSSTPHMALNHLRASYTKNIRSQLAKGYFEAVFPVRLAKTLNVSEKDILDGSGVFGFNRLFSPKNTGGASPYSDVDFKIVVDNSLLSKLSKDFRDPEILKKKVGEELESAKNDFKQIHIPFDVSPAFTVWPPSTVRKVLDKTVKEGEGELNFLATIMGNTTHLSGNPKIESKIFEKFREIVDQEEVARRLHQQNLGKETTKYSLGALDEMPGNHIGKTGYDSNGEWELSTKYICARLYDTDPNDPQAAQMNEIAMNLQMDQVDYLLNHYEKDYGKRISRSEIESKYDVVSANRWADLYAHNSSGMHEIIQKSCLGKLVAPSICDKDLKLLTQALGKLGADQRLQRRTLIKKFGERYFRAILSKSQEIAKGLEKATK